MANRYDYGSFSSAAPRLLKPLIASANFSHIRGTAFGRAKNEWTEGFFLQQSAWGSGDFCVNFGIEVPGLDSLWKVDATERAFGLVISDRLNQQGVPGDNWYPASDKASLKASLNAVASDLKSAEPWFAKIQSMADIVKQFEARNEINDAKDIDDLSSISSINYAFLLLLAGEKDGARHWLAKAETFWQSVVHDNEEKAKRRRPGREAQQYYDDDRRRLAVVCSALAEHF